MSRPAKNLAICSRVRATPGAVFLNVDHSPFRGRAIGDRKRIVMSAFDTLHGIGDKAGVKTAHLQLLSKYTKPLIDHAFSAVIRAGRYGYARRAVV
jgi:hypothetical protein